LPFLPALLKSASVSERSITYHAVPTYYRRYPPTVQPKTKKISPYKMLIFTYTVLAQNWTCYLETDSSQ
jgi:hypothetical protein